MPTGRSIFSACASRTAVAGNPSDGYGGAVLSFPVDELTAVAALEPGDTFEVQGDADMQRLLAATAAEFTQTTGLAPTGTLSATTTIPRSVGLAGSSALVVAALRSLAAAHDHVWAPIELAEAALRVERKRLGISGGMQDPLVQAVNAPVLMEFEPPLDYRTISPIGDLPLFIAWAAHAAESSDTVHRSLRRRFDAGDVHIRTSMSGLADQARRAADAIERGDLAQLAAAINRTFEVRALMIDIDPATTALAQLGRKVGAAVNTTGSGGAIIGLLPSVARVDDAIAAFEGAGYDAIALT